jgi:hypothetical protein
MSSVQDAFRNTVDSYPGGAKALAPRIEMNHWSLSHQATESGTARAGLLVAQKMMRATGDLRVLNAMAEDLGCLIVPLPAALQAHDGDAMQRLAALAKEFSDLMQAVMVTTADGEISDNEMARLEREWGEMVAVGQGVMGALRKMHSEGKPAQLRVYPREA